MGVACCGFCVLLRVAAFGSRIARWGPGLVWGFYAPSAEVVFLQCQREIDAVVKACTGCALSIYMAACWLKQAASLGLLVSYITLAASVARSETGVSNVEL